MLHMKSPEKCNHSRPLNQLNLNHIKAAKHFLTGTEFNKEEIDNLLQLAINVKKYPNKYRSMLQDKHLALLFDKPSLRTRFSFSIAMAELGGDSIESVSNTRKFEEPEDQAGVINGYCHAVVIRTYEDELLSRFAHASKIPVINGLSDLHHPCQIFSDLFTLKEIFSKLEGLTLAYIGDGNNILHSLLLLAPQMGINVHYACPAGREPNNKILNQSLQRIQKPSGFIRSFPTPKAAVQGADAVYTDVWASMGFEAKTMESMFVGYQVNEMLMQHAQSNAIFMHCLPMLRGKEVSTTLPDTKCSVIYKQSENRLHLQKALLLTLLKHSLNVVD